MWGSRRYTPIQSIPSNADESKNSPKMKNASTAKFHPTVRSMRILLDSWSVSIYFLISTGIVGSVSGWGLIWLPAFVILTSHSCVSKEGYWNRKIHTTINAKKRIHKYPFLCVYIMEVWSDTPTVGTLHTKPEAGWTNTAKFRWNRCRIESVIQCQFCVRCLL